MGTFLAVVSSTSTDGTSVTEANVQWVVDQLTAAGHTLGTVVSAADSAHSGAGHDFIAIILASSSELGSKYKTSAKPVHAIVGGGNFAPNLGLCGSMSDAAGNTWNVVEAGDLDAGLVGDLRVWQSGSTGQKRTSNPPVGSTPIAYVGSGNTSNLAAWTIASGGALADGSTAANKRAVIAATNSSSSWPLSTSVFGTGWAALLAEQADYLTAGALPSPTLSVDTVSHDVLGGAVFEFTPTGSGGAGGPYTYTVTQTSGDAVTIYTDGAKRWGVAPLSSGAVLTFSVVAEDSAGTDSSAVTVTVTVTDTRAHIGVGDPTTSSGWTASDGSAITPTAMAAVIDKRVGDSAHIKSDTGTPLVVPVDPLPTTATTTGHTLYAEFAMQSAGSVTLELLDAGTPTGVTAVKSGAAGERVRGELTLTAGQVSALSSRSAVSLSLTPGA